MSTSKNWATAALVTCALLLSGCAALEDMASDFSPSGEEVAQDAPSPIAEAPISTGEYDLVESCNAFFNGPIVSTVSEAAKAVQAPLDEDLTGTVSSISSSLGLLIGKSDEVSIAHLEAVRAPFDQALDGSIARPTAVTKAIEYYKATCTEAGFKG
ncbi:hypothetical protein APR04_003442 [Promicromonospora umidemergens]|uniref:Lipoprotein n=1 Tax=Promicromonospora umidemergens TaxID=629679 RepID=A0ABP8Y3K5_9MICO|nr:hypothetical protein [Promicromonospora umidemergens]MCP2284519.1 hypothetical protein [Promicromonospora umidemergens]